MNMHCFIFSADANINPKIFRSQFVNKVSKNSSCLLFTFQDKPTSALVVNAVLLYAYETKRTYKYYVNQSMTNVP